MTILTALYLATQKLQKSSPSPHLDAEVLLSYVLKKPKEYLFANPDFKLNKLKARSYKLLIAKRSKRWPVAYLIGHKEFFGLDFKVTPDVLIPRPETELLVEQALKEIKDERLTIRNVIDVGTGSGCIVISLAKQLSLRAKRGNLRLFATDISTKALRVAKLNAKRHGVAKKIKFLRGDLLSTILKSKNLSLDSSIFIANLPYLSPKKIKSNPDLRHEPRSALDGGKDGLKYFRMLFRQINSNVIASTAKQSKDRLPRRPAIGGTPRNDNLTLLLEHDPSQKSALSKLTKKYFPKSKLKFHRDLSRNLRITELSC